VPERQLPHETDRRGYCRDCGMPRIFRDGKCWKCGRPDDGLAPFAPEARARWPVPDSVKGASAVDAFMWYCGEGMKTFFGLDPTTVAYNDFSGHTIAAGAMKLTLDWSADTQEADDDL
jgi:hypothetical protein